MSLFNRMKSAEDEMDKLHADIGIPGIPKGLLQGDIVATSQPISALAPMPAYPPSSQFGNDRILDALAGNMDGWLIESFNVNNSYPNNGNEVEITLKIFDPRVMQEFYAATKTAMQIQSNRHMWINPYPYSTMPLYELVDAEYKDEDEEESDEQKYVTSFKEAVNG